MQTVFCLILLFKLVIGNDLYQGQLLGYPTTDPVFDCLSCVEAGGSFCFTLGTCDPGVNCPDQIRATALDQCYRVPNGGCSILEGFDSNILYSTSSSSSQRTLSYRLGGASSIARGGWFSASTTSASYQRWGISNAFQATSNFQQTPYIGAFIYENMTSQYPSSCSIYVRDNLDRDLTSPAVSIASVSSSQGVGHLLSADLSDSLWRTFQSNGLSLSRTSIERFGLECSGPSSGATSFRASPLMICTSRPFLTQPPTPVPTPRPTSSPAPTPGTEAPTPLPAPQTSSPTPVSEPPTEPPSFFIPQPPTMPTPEPTRRPTIGDLLTGDDDDENDDDSVTASSPLDTGFIIAIILGLLVCLVILICVFTFARQHRNSRTRRLTTKPGGGRRSARRTRSATKTSHGQGSTGVSMRRMNQRNSGSSRVVDAPDYGVVLDLPIPQQQAPAAGKPLALASEQYGSTAPIVASGTYQAPDRDAMRSSGVYGGAGTATELVGAIYKAPGSTMGIYRAPGTDLDVAMEAEDHLDEEDAAVAPPTEETLPTQYGSTAQLVASKPETDQADEIYAVPQDPPIGIYAAPPE